MSTVKKPSVGGSDYCVFQDEQRHTCIRVRCDKAGVWFIPFEASNLDLHFLPNKEFEQRFTRALEDYPVRKAARMYVSPWQTISPDARKHLFYLTGGNFPETAKPLNFQNKESIMTDEAIEKAEAKKTKAAPTKPKAGKVKEAAPAKAEKATPKKVAAPKVESTGGSKTRVSKEAGKKIKVLEKNPAVRPGSSREAQYKVLLACKTTDEAAEKLRDLTDKPWDLIRLAVSAGVIEMY